MTGRAEVARLKSQLDATFQRIKALQANPDLEIQSDFARYLCVLVSGYLEKAIGELLLEHARNSGSKTFQRFVESRTRHFTNVNRQKLVELMGSFDADWRIAMESFLVDDVKDALDSVASIRNRIAHGGAVPVTYQRISDYYLRVQSVINRVAGLPGM